MLDPMDDEPVEMDVPTMLRAQGIRMQAIERHQETFDERQDKFDKDLAANNATTNRIEADTKELVQLLNSWKGAFHIIDLTARVLKPVGIIGSVVAGVIGSVWGFLTLIKGGGRS